MRKLSIGAIIGVAALCLLMPPAFAGSLSISWGNDQPGTSAQPAIANKKSGPPAHAQAHGYRSKRQYHYYPSCSVYRDSQRGLFFYFSDSGWKVATSLPHELRVQLGSAVSIEMDTDKPYIYNSQHKKQYPPGQTYNHKEKNGKKRAKK